MGRVKVASINHRCGTIYSGKYSVQLYLCDSKIQKGKSNSFTIDFTLFVDRKIIMINSLYKCPSELTKFLFLFLFGLKPCSPLKSRGKYRQSVLTCSLQSSRSLHKHLGMAKIKFILVLVWVWFYFNFATSSDFKEREPICHQSYSPARGRPSRDFSMIW